LAQLISYQLSVISYQGLGRKKREKKEKKRKKKEKEKKKK